MYHFHRGEIANPDSGKIMTHWLAIPDAGFAGYTEAIENPAGQDRLSGEVDGEQRVFSGPLLGMATIYNAQLTRRIDLGHDCGVFALSCERDDPFSKHFFASGQDTVDIGTIGLPRSVRAVQHDGSGEAGQLVLMVSADVEQPHIAVQATADGQHALYLSKIGTDGPVILSDLEQVANLYDSTLASVVSGLAPFGEAGP